VAIDDELLAIRLELKGAREAITGLGDVNKAQQGVATSTRKAGDESARAEKKTLSLGNAYGKLRQHAGLALGFLGVSGVFAIERAVDNTEDLALATSGLSRNFGFQTNVASRWAAVMFSRQVDPKAMSMAFGTLSTKLVEAGRKGGSLLTPFHQLGISQEEVTKGAHNYEWGLLRVAKALGEEEGGAKRSTAAKALLGKGFQTLTPLFAEGVEGLKEQLHWADEYGATLSGPTKDGIMDMVKSQRELKIAQLGLQISMTKALMPAIEAGEDQVKEFIKTLNDPNMSGEEKIAAIERQFEGLETELIHIFEAALPGIAEHAGQLGVKMALALFQGFHNSDIVGKLVIAGWVFSLFGGEAVAKAGAQRVGAELGFAVGTGLAVAAVSAFVGYEIYEHMSEGTKTGIRRWGSDAGEWFVNGLIGVINTGIREINDALDAANAFSILGVDAPHIGEIGGVNFHGSQRQYNEEAKTHREEGLISGPGGKLIPGKRLPKGTHPGDIPRKRRNMSLETPKLPSLGGEWRGGGGGGRVLEVHTHVHVDGREVAEAVTRHAEDEAAFR
jgi:hypothetical protein